ncbi:MAG: DUF3826 domain-containing protein [Pirellula sp.]
MKTKSIIESIVPSSVSLAVAVGLAMLVCRVGNAQDEAIPKDEHRKRAAEWIEKLGLTDVERRERLIRVVATHLQAVQSWHDEHPAKTVPEGINPLSGKRLSELDRKMIADSAIPVSVHERLMAGLRKDLSESDVEKILDQYTIGKVAFTMNGYKAIVNDLTADEEKTILGYLKEAREMAIDYRSMKEISGIFEIYKTKSEQHLISNGRNWRNLYKTYVDSVKAAKQATEKQAAEKQSAQNLPK